MSLSPRSRRENGEFLNGWLDSFTNRNDSTKVIYYIQGIIKNNKNKITL